MVFRFIFRFLAHWPLLLRAIFAAIAILYASALLSADWLLSSAWRQKDQHGVVLQKMALARSIFPLDHRFRKGGADYLSRVRWKGSLPLAIEATQRTLRTDQFSMDMHRNLAGFYYEQGNTDAAMAELAFIKRYLPNNRPIIVVNTNPATN